MSLLPDREPPFPPLDPARFAADPMTQFSEWYAAAESAGFAEPDAMALATADRRGRPSVRYVLLKGADERGFTFFTDGRSRKGRELAARPRASVAFYWDATGKQVRIEGRIVPVSKRYRAQIERIATRVTVAS